MPDFVRNLRHDRIKAVIRVSLLKIFDNRPASDGYGQKDGKGQGGYYPAGMRVVERR